MRTAGGRLLKSLPEFNRPAWIVPRARHVDKPLLIGFGLLQPVVRQRDQKLADPICFCRLVEVRG